MKLKDLLYKVNLLKVVGSTNIQITDVQFDSRKIKTGGLFVAVKGTVSDGHKYIKDVIKNGAVAIIVEKIPIKLDKNVTYVQVASSTSALGVVAANFYGNPSKK